MRNQGNRWLTPTECFLAEWILDAFPLDRRDEKPARAAADWGALVRSAEENAIAPLLYTALKKSGRDRETPSLALERLRTAYLRSDVANWTVLQELVRVLDLFERAQIPALVLKGCALATTLYPEPAVRPMSDIDLLIPQTALERASALLIHQGYASPVELQDGFVQRFVNYRAFHRGGNHPAHIEVHWHLFKSPYYCRRVPIEWFWERTTEIGIQGRKARAFTPAAQLVHLSAHFALHHRAERLIWSYDLALLLARHRDSLDWESVLEAADRFGLTQPLRVALSRVTETWGVEPPAAVRARLDTLKPALKDRVAFAMMSARRGEARVILDALSMPTFGMALRVWLDHIFPSRDYMRERYHVHHARWLPLWYAWRLFDGLSKLIRSAFSMAAQQ